MNRTLTAIPTDELIRELEDRHVFSALFLAMTPAIRKGTPVGPLVEVQAPQQDAVVTQLPVKPAEQAPSKESILRALGSRLDVSKDDRTIEEAAGGGEGDAPMEPTRYIVNRVEKEILAEGAEAAMRERLDDPDVPQAEKDEIRRLMELHRSSRKSLDLQQVISINKSQASDAFIQPSLPGVPGQGVSSEEIRGARNWKPLPRDLVGMSTGLGGGTTRAVRAIAKAADDDAVLSTYAPGAIICSDGGFNVTCGDVVITSRLLYILAKGVREGERNPEGLDAVKAIYSCMQDGSNKGPDAPLLWDWSAFQRSPLGYAETYRAQATEYVRDKVPGLPWSQRTHLARLLNPEFVERAVPDSFYEDGPGSSSRKNVVREAAEGFFDKPKIGGSPWLSFQTD